MFLLPVLILSVAQSGNALRGDDTTTYSSPALRTIVSEAAVLNRRVPEALGGYRAQLESEFSIGNRRSEGVELTISLEQVASRLSWDRTGAYEQVVVGYRSQSIGSSFASLGFVRSGWAIPSLYGNRIALLFGRDTTNRRGTSRTRAREVQLQAIHPLSDDRERYYRYRGGDTIVTMRAEGREIPIVRIEVSLRENVPARSVVFLGEMDLDAARRHIVRLRGYFAIVGGPKPRFDILRQAGLQGIAFVEAENAEVDGNFWLPSEQRFEAHAASFAIGDGRGIFRILTRFVDREILPPPPGLVVGAPADTLAIHPFRLTVLPPDTMRTYLAWSAELGTMTSSVSAEDFADVAPDRWSTSGPPRVTIETERLGDVLRVDRVEGLFTGVGAVVRLRDAAPGLTLRGATGFAWNEGAMRGRAVLEYRRGASQWAIRAQRSLDLTNDFRNPVDSGSTLAAILGRDNYDYLDRQTLNAQWLRFLGTRRRTQLRFESGLARDAAVEVNLVRSPLGIGQDFRPNRTVRPGSYLRSAMTFEYRPDVSVEFLRRGVGAKLHYERGDGDLSYQRVEARATIRGNRGPYSLGARADVGLTNPDAPPQQFFELGQNQNLPGYDYKEFAGDRAAVLRVVALRRLPFLGAPLRVTPRFWLPPIAPSIAVGLQAGWAGASTPAALATTIALGSVPTGHPRASASLTVRFLGESIGVGIAKPLDHPSPVRWIAEFGQRP